MADITRLGIHESVSAVFPPEVLAGTMTDAPTEVAVIDDSEIGTVDAVVTFDHHEDFLTEVAWIHSIQAGYDKFPLDELDRRGIVLTNSSGIHGESVGETVTGMMLSFARRLHTYVRNQETNAWDRPAWDEPFTLAGESVCVVGLGTLGQGVAQRAAGMDMDVCGVRRKPTRVPHVRTVYTPDRLEEAIEDVRFVVLTVPLTEETEGMLGEEEFEAMPDDAYLVNVARGPVVDEAALVEALEAGDIAGAGLDVFETEPLPSDSPLWDMDEVIITPHVAALTRDYYRDIAAIVSENLRLLQSGASPVNQIV
ncbi:MAG: D-2-hydroxyacid dehydrogenase [Halodesulfurarchaeum sp.]